MTTLRDRSNTMASSPLSSPPPLSPGSTSSTVTSVVTPDRSLTHSDLPPRKTSFLLHSPPEILHRVLLSSGVDDLPGIAATAKTCRELRSFIYEAPDCALWRDIHLSRWDDPRRSGNDVVARTDFDWKKRVQDREFVSRIFSWPAERYGDIAPHLDMIVQTLLGYYLDLPPTAEGNPSPSPRSDKDTRNSEILEDLLRSPVFEHIILHLSTRETRPLLRPLRGQPGNPNRKPQREVVNPDLCRLHTLLAPFLTDDEEEHRQFRGRMREIVYTASNFTENNDWGPFKPDGTTDWVLADALSTVMIHNARDVLGMGEDGWKSAVLPLSYGLDPVRGWGMDHLQRPEHLEDDEVWDWAGVEGRWCGSYAFLDYADWMSLNEPRLILLRRSINELDLSIYNEAIGDLMRLDLVLDRPSDPPSDLPSLTTPLPTSDLLPSLYFHGSNQPSGGSLGHSHSSFVRGVVRLTADHPPMVRWTLVIRYGGEDRWRLEGVQPGGRGSTRGFFGTWTDAMKEEHSPNGPVWYWKP